MSDYKMTIGLEIHAELKTKTKMFCGCLNLPAEKTSEPNVDICPVCMGHPGTLPVINFEAVKKVLTVGAAIGADLADFTEFDRKNYFYPDIPKGYQISQYKYPLVSGGELAGVKLTRVHLEEDTARSSHETDDGTSLVDFNRAGVPLMELVTEPVIHSADEAMKFAKELQLLLNYLNVSDANMEKGEMRVEVNISVSSGEVLGTKVEVKNINSFRAVGKSIEFEYQRQVDLLERGDKVVQETRGWDENKSITFSQRSKESAHDYRYFPEPDLPKLIISEIPEFSLSALKKDMPELPWQKRERYAKDFGIKSEDIEFYVSNAFFASFFEQTVSKIKTVKNDIVKLVSNYITSDLVGLFKLKNDNSIFEKITPDYFAKLIVMFEDGLVSSRGVKDVLKIMSYSGGDPIDIVNSNGLAQKNNVDELKKIAEKIMIDNPLVVNDYKNGKISAFQFFVGQGMKESKGSANPEVLKSIFLELLK